MGKINYHFEDSSGNVHTHVFDDTPEQNALRGTCSGIPECCITFFINEWKFGDHPNKTSHIKAGFGYIPCPACLKSGNRVDIHHCVDGGCTCGQVK